MTHFAILTAVAAPIAASNVDTDQIFPSRFTSKRREDGMFGKYFLHDHRFDQQGQPNERFILNDRRLAGARIIVAAANYACGSARPGAIHAHLDYGIQAVVAESFGPIFSTVAFKSGLLTIELDKEAAKHIRDQLLRDPGSLVTIDLDEQVVVGPDRHRFAFDIDHFVKRMFVEGRSEIEVTLSLRHKIEAFEAHHRTWLPWLHEHD